MEVEAREKTWVADWRGKHQLDLAVGKKREGTQHRLLLRQMKREEKNKEQGKREAGGGGGLGVETEWRWKRERFGGNRRK